MAAGKTYIKIASQTLGSATSSVTFSNLPQNYTDLVLVFQFELSQTDNIRLQFNGDAGNNYSFTALFGDGSSAQSNRVTSTSGIGAGFDDSSGNITRVNIQNYTNTVTNKTCIMRTDSSTYTVARVGLWRNTSAITSIRIYGENGSTNINSGSIFTIYGIEASRAPKAIGGTVTTDGSYWIHTFTSSGTLIPQESIDNADYLVVAGGGGAGKDYSGGGGAGGLRSTVSATGGGGSLESKVNLSKDTLYTVTVGAGGAGGTTSGAQGNKGSNSVFATITSEGGGYGAKGDSDGGAGGSGGGSAWPNGSNTRTGGAGTTGQGYKGGDSFRQSGTLYQLSGGGGGAGAAGGNATSGSASGAGGNGVAVAISGSSVTYAGGGGGGGYVGYSITAGAGGSGGGGAGKTADGVAGDNGTANTGGGGGGGAGNQGNGGSGGSGIVIVRYPV